MLCCVPFFVRVLDLMGVDLWVLDVRTQKVYWHYGMLDDCFVQLRYAVTC